jgi:hypothetical protein
MYSTGIEFNMDGTSQVLGRHDFNVNRTSQVLNRN